MKEPQYKWAEGKTLHLRSLRSEAGFTHPLIKKGLETRAVKYWIYVQEYPTSLNLSSSYQLQVPGAFGQPNKNDWL